MVFASINIHVESHKIHSKGNAIPIGNLNLFLNLFSILGHADFLLLKITFSKSQRVTYLNINKPTIFFILVLTWLG